MYFIFYFPCTLLYKHNLPLIANLFTFLLNLTACLSLLWHIVRHCLHLFINHSSDLYFRRPSSANVTLSSNCQFIHPLINRNHSCVLAGIAYVIVSSYYFHVLLSRRQTHTQALRCYIPSPNTSSMPLLYPLLSQGRAVSHSSTLNIIIFPIFPNPA